MSRSKVPKLLSLIYVHNPFYLISACLFVYGLKLLFREGNSAVLFERGSVAYMEPWGLMSSFVGVTLLMTLTAILIVRLGKVWEDARSLVLIVLLMLLAISVSFDEIITVLSDSDTSRRHLFLMFALGVGFAIGVGETLLRGLGIRLPIHYRLPLHAFLGLFFLWPALLLPEVTEFSQQTTRWFIAAFPVVAALLTLTLVPAVRKGAAGVRQNGTPWSWPLFPWTPFVFIGIAVLFRSYSLTMSFDPADATGHYWDTTFGVYQLVPLLLAILTILLEIGLVEQKQTLQRGVMLIAPLSLVLSCPWLVPWSHLASYRTFTTTVVSDLASPVFVTLVGLVLMYGYAWLRKVRHAEVGFYGMVFLLCTISPRAFGSEIWSLRSVQLSWWPLYAVAGLQIASGARRSDSLRVFTGLLLSVVATHFALRSFPETRAWRYFVDVHLAWSSVVLVGLVMKDEFAAALKQQSPWCVPGTMAIGMIQLNQIGLSLTAVLAYGIAITILAGVLYLVLHDRGYLLVAAIHSAIGLLGCCGWCGYQFVIARLPSGLKPVLLAAGSFLIAVFISVLKSGLSRRLKMCWLTKQRSQPSQPVT